MWVARLRDCRSPGWCSRWNTRDGGGPTLLGGVKEVGGVGHPRASTLTPRVSESLVCPPGSLRSHIRQSAEPSRSLSPSTDEGCPARPSGCLAFLRVTVDFFKIQRSAWRVQETDGSSVEASVRRTKHEDRYVFSVRAQPVDRFCVVR